MPPKRKNNNANKKRRPKIDKTATPNLTPSTSPSKGMKNVNHSPNTTLTPQDQSPPITPTTQSSDENKLILIDSQNQPSITAIINENHNQLDHPPIKSSNHPTLPSTIPSRVDDPSSIIQLDLNSLDSKINPDYIYSAELSNESSIPIKSTIQKPSENVVPELDRIKRSGGSTENSDNLKIHHSKHEAHRNSDLLPQSNRNNSSVNKNTTQTQPSADRVLKEIIQHNNPPNGTNDTSDQIKPHHDRSDLESVKPLEDSTKSSNHRSNSVKKPIKHVKFTNNLKNDPPQRVSSQENEKLEPNHQNQVNHHNEHNAVSKNHHIAVRREMSGAADQFDFDAQQRRHAGPGGGMVKKPRHTPTNSIHSMASSSNVEEPSQPPADSTSSDSHDEPNQLKKHDKGFQHAQRCFQSMSKSKESDLPLELEPDILQIYLSYFDQNQDGLLDPLDTWRGFRRLGFGLIIATFATITLHVIMMPFIGLKSGLTPDTLGLCHLPIGHHFSESTRNFFNIIASSLSRYVCMDRKEHLYPDKIGPSVLWKEMHGHFGAHQTTDPIGWLRVVFGWIVVVALTWPSDLIVKSDLIDEVFTGEILFLVAQDLSC